MVLIINMFCPFQCAHVYLFYTTQTMAIATLALCYNNKDVFRGVVKIRKGEAVHLIMESTSMENFKKIMIYYSKIVS